MKVSGVRRVLALLLVLPGVLLGQDAELAVRNWSAPPYFQPQSSPSASGAAQLLAKSAEAAEVVAAPLPFVALSPCRLADTRPENGYPSPFGPPAMAPSTPRDFPVAGHCGVPIDATAVSFNFTVVRTLGLGYLATYPEGEAWGGTSTLNYVAGQIVANNAVSALGSTGAITAFVSGAQADLIIDINGYYGGTLVTSVNGMSGDLTLVQGDNVTITPSGNTLTVSASGQTGPPGPQGPQGPQGAQGAQGVQGAIGPQGPQGAQGVQGPIGPQGPQGSTGDAGAIGPQGLSVSFLGAWDGGTTYSQLQIAFFGGSSWISLIDDNTGNQPDTSPAQWSEVAQRGDKGDKGDTGNTGDTGAQGIQGVQGPQGDQGVQGVQGIQGLQGASVSFLGAWDGGTTYSTLQTVSFGGSSWVSLVDNNTGNQPDTNPAQWSLVAQRGDKGDKGDKGDTGDTGAQGIQGVQGPQGDQGVQGVQGLQGASVSFLGAWDGGTTYSQLEIVSFGGSSWVSLVNNNTGNQPDTNPAQWSLVANKGDKGDKGDTGDQGIQGVKGDKGDQGIQGVKGDKGDQGIQGVKGDKGDTGSQGIQGVQGVKGDKGDKGDTGSQGIPGPQGAPGGVPIIGGTSGTSKLNNARYMGMFAGNQSSTERLVQNIMPTAGKVSNFYIFIETAPSSGASWTFTLRKNGVDTALTCTVSNTNQVCSDTTHSVNYVAGDLVSVREASSGNPDDSAGQWTAVFLQ